MTDAVSRSVSSTSSLSGKPDVRKPPIDKQALREDAREAFQKAIAGTFYRHMLKALRESTGQAAYMNGGQAEEIFMSQLDEVLIDRMSESSGGKFSDRLFEQQFPQFRAFAMKAPQSGSEPATDDATPAKPVDPAHTIQRVDAEQKRFDAEARQLNGDSLSSFSVDV